MKTAAYASFIMLSLYEAIRQFLSLPPNTP